MARFNTPGQRVQPRGAIRTTGEETATFEGGLGFVRDAKSELFTLAVTNLVGRDTFYESAAARDARFQKLVAQVTAEDPDWVAGLIAFLRGEEVNLRTAPMIAAVEYALAGGPNRRRVLASALQRADEVGEAIAYYMQRTGRRTLPGGIQRGFADAATSLFNEYTAMKYDGVDSRAIRMGDVIELTHPTPKADWQRTLFEYLLDRRHHSTDVRADVTKLPMIQERRRMREIPVDERRAALLADPDMLRRSGQTWEDVSGWLNDGKGMTSEVWEALLGPDAKGLPYMALIRNLRNFGEAGIDDEIVAKVVARIQDPEEVAHSRQFPFRFLNAFEAAPIDYAPALEKALFHSTGNIPEGLGDSLIVIDTSASMTQKMPDPVTRKTPTRSPLDIAAVVAMSLFVRGANADIAIFGDSSARVSGITKTTGILRGVQKIQGLVGSVGHWSNGHGAIDRFFDPAKHKRVFVFTDGQLSDSGRYPLKSVKRLYTFNVGGYAASHVEVGKDGSYELAGFTDATFKLVPLLERGREAGWPWE